MERRMKLFRNVVILIFTLLIWSILDFETSPFYFFSTFFDKYHSFKLATNEINTWAIRGQIGDILAGHFSALAFFAIALSIYFQSEGNKQIQKSIEQQETLINQQKDALEIQSKALKVQTEEFIRNNLNIRLEKYYLLLDKHLEVVTEDYLYAYLGKKDAIRKFSKLNPSEYNQSNKDKIDEFEKITDDQSTKIRPIVMTLNLIYDEIIKIKETSPSVSQTYIEELRLRLYSNELFRTIYTYIEEYKEIPVFDLYKEQK